MDLDYQEKNQQQHQPNLMESSTLKSTVLKSPRSIYEDEYEDDYLLYQEEEEEAAAAAAAVHKMEQESINRVDNTVILLDYDDTLLASSWLAARQLGLNSKPEEIQKHAEELRVLEACAAKLLSKSIELGDVHLVTNAEEGWVQLTVEKFMPALRPLLPHVTVLSARSMFEEYNPTCPRTWKIMAFRRQISLSLQLSGRVMMNNQPSSLKKVHIISMGDSHHEREALKIVAAEFPDSYSKSIKFVERPDLSTLQQQMELVHSCIDYVAGYDGDLDLLLSQIIPQDQLKTINA